MRRGIALALGSAVLFGASVPLAKSLVGMVPPLLLAGLLYLGSGLGLLVLHAGRTIFSSQGGSNLPSRGEWRWLGAAIVVGGVAGPLALMYGLTSVTASTASLLLNLEAVFTALLAWFLFRENFDRRVALGMTAIVAGGLLLAWSPEGGARVEAGAAWVAAACVCWAIDNNLTRKVSGSDPVVVAGVKGAVAGSVNTGLALLAGHSLPGAGVVATATLVGWFGYGISLVLFVLALRHLGTARTGAYFSVAPFVGAVMAVLVVGEDPTWQLAAAGALMAVGVWLHLTERHRHEHTHEPLEHAHEHVHDEHHRHRHDFPWDGREPHVHRHVHLPLIHTHVHYPDIHHRHPH